MKIQIDIGSILLFVFLIIFLISTIGFLFVKKNDLFGIRVYQSFESEEIWHRIHVIASLWTIPFDAILFILLFVNSALLKSILAFIISFVLIFIYILIPNVTTRKHFKEQKLKEAKKLEMQIKKESGWL